MKIFLFVCILWPVYFNASAQHVVLANEALNVAYVGIANPLTVGVEGCNASNIIVSTENGTLVNKGNGKYDYTPAKQGKTSIKVEMKKGSEVKIIGYKVYRVKEMPMPVAMVADKVPTGMEGIGDIQPGLVAVSANADLRLKFQIVSYSVSGYNNNNEVVFFNENQGSYFNMETRNGFTKLGSGSKLIFSNIQCKYPDGSIHKLEDLTKY